MNVDDEYLYLLIRKYSLKNAIMFEPCYSSLVLDALEILENERQLIGKPYRLYEVSSRCLSVYVDNLIEVTKPFFDGGTEELTPYYKHKIESFELYLGSSNLNEVDIIKYQYGIGYTLVGKKLYEFKSLKIETSHKHFEYWLAVKLSQYDYVSFTLADREVRKVVEYYKNTFGSFNYALHSLLQNHGSFLGEKIISIIKEYLEDIKTSQRSFLHLGVRYNSEYLYREGFEKIKRVHDSLKIKGFIRIPASEKEFQHFRNLFLNKIIPNNEKVQWASSLRSLKHFIDVIFKSKIVEEKKTADKWTTASLCFQIKGKDITPKQISGASRRNELQIKKLNEILEDF